MTNASQSSHVPTGSRILTGSNPFSTRCIRPGALDFIFEPGDSADKIIQRLKDNQWRGAILGPHGSGKSTLLAALAPILQRAGRRVERFMLTQAEPALKLTRSQTSHWNHASLIVIDGYEQLSWLRRWRLRRLCRRAGAGLLVTAHQKVSLPAVYQTQPSLKLAQQITAQLAPGGRSAISSEDVTQCFQASRGDLREMLFALYDLVEQRRS